MDRVDALNRLVAQPIAHRGLHGCGRMGPVENSIGAARAAITHGFGIECDIQLSADGEAMVFHDEDLSRLTGEGGLLRSRTRAELEMLRLTGGSDHIPSLTQFLNAIDGRMPLVIEIKSDGSGDLRLADRALSCLEAHGGAVALESFDAALVTHLLDKRVPFPVGLVGPPENASETDPDLIARCDFLSWSIRELENVAVAFPEIRRTSWTVRNRKQERLARLWGAQIVFEGFEPRDATSTSSALSTRRN